MYFPFRNNMIFKHSLQATKQFRTLGITSLSPYLNKFILPACTSCRNINLKPKLKEFVHCDFVDNMDYGVYALTTGYIKEAAMEAARLAIVRRAKTKQVTKIVSETPFTKKPLGTRMGKGKGKLDYWASKSIAGQVLLEFNCDNDSLARQAFKQVKAKLPVRLHLRMKPKQPKRVLTADELLAMVQEDKERNERLQTQQPNWTQR